MSHRLRLCAGEPSGGGFKMTIIDTAKLTSKGQITIPGRIRELLKISAGASIAFGVSKEGVLLLPCKVTAESPYTSSEWAKIEKLASRKGRVCKSVKKAKKHIEAL
ncbi:MAG: AbrB/MazE/SpoVT family DNA-binding domain-containing protein [Candidatus Omnitrophica bacterium]|nr:AbrB/MazE/SpoVT family DNA-binding domain-containing protein [Candidatus Omnitrophota bacterium]